LADTDQPRVPRDVFYRVIKLYLDIATSLLLFTGGYEPSYAKRSQRLSWLATQRTGGADIPLPLVDFSREVVTCTNWKLAPDDAFERQASWRWCFQALEYAGLLWRWELLRLTRAADTSDNEQLMASWMDMQPLPDRLRGWLYVWRGCGWLRSSPHWLHWTRLARRGSPRYWIYSAVGEILPNAVEGASSSQALLQRWRKRLPLVMPAAPEDSVTAWRQLTKDMAWNYHKFLEHTRA